MSPSAKIRATALASACAFLVIVFQPTAAVAGHGDDFQDRDNNSQAYNRKNMTESGRVACNWGADRLANTEVRISYGSSDIHCYDGYYNKWWLGYANCTDVNWWNGRCDHYRLRFDLTGYGGGIGSRYERRHTWQYIGCHEFGHTSSVGHRASDANHNSCMKDAHGHRWLDNHDHVAINRDY